MTVGNKWLLVTGGDDGRIIGSELICTQAELTSTGNDVLPGSGSSVMTRRSTQLYSHISSVKCLSCVHSLTEPDTLLIFTGGGRAQLAISKVKIGK